ncbi:hypothetical protein L1887_04528 [Cichorium endivia]|nr:hypothetical protein L1887_04528 [Cichorium endivia]
MASVDQDSNLDGATNPSATEGGSDANAVLKRNSGKGVAICNNASKEDKAVCAALLEKPKEKKKEKRKREEEMRAEVEIEIEDNEFHVMSKRKRRNNLGPLDKFTNPINPEENNDSFDPGTWWMTYGNSTPTLQKMAIKILSLTTSSSGCERNWSAFEGIHTKKRNRLDSQILHNLVYVQFNSKLINKCARVRNQNTDVLRSVDASKAQSWIVSIIDDEDEIEEGDGLEVGGEGIGEARELHDDDFVSDEEQVECEEDFEFNSDEEGFVEGNEDSYMQG